MSSAQWMILAQVEYAQLYRRWLRLGLVAPASTDTAFTGATTTLTNALAVLGVAEDTGTFKRLLYPAASAFGREPYWNPTNGNGKSTSWVADGAADTLVLTLDPPDPTGSYIARWIAAPAYATDTTATVDVPYGTDERLVLGIARRSNLKAGANSQLLNGLINEADAEMAFLATSRVNPDGPRVRRVRSTVKPRMNRFLGFPTDPAHWVYF